VAALCEACRPHARAHAEIAPTLAALTQATEDFDLAAAATAAAALERLLHALPLTESPQHA